MYRANDILIRKTTESDIIWVSQRLVVAVCGVSDEYFRKSRVVYKQSLPKSWLVKLEGKAEFFLGDSGKSWRWGRKNGQYYYDYDRIPDKAPASYRSKLPTKNELTEVVESNNLRGSRERTASMRKVLLEAVESMYSNEDAMWINANSGYQIDASTARDYAKAIAWCRLIKTTVTNGNVSLFETTTIASFYDLCLEVLKGLQIKNLRINTVASLRNKIAIFPDNIDDQRRWVISAKFGNDNSRKVGKTQLVDYETGVIYPFDIHQAVMYSVYMNMDGPQKETLNALYNDHYVPIMSELGTEPVSERAFCHHLSRLPARLLNDRQRHGDDYYKKKLLTYIPSEKLQYAHSLFCGDGSGLIGYRYIEPNGKLKVRNLYAMLITDVATGYIAGYDVAPEGLSTETSEMAQNAVKMVASQCDNLTMFEFISDNHPAFSCDESKEYFADVFNVVRTIQAGNSQANPAEIMFKIFKGAVLRRLRSFVRSSHYATTANRANTDKICKEDYPDYNGAVALLQQKIDEWNNNPQKGKDNSPAELFTTTKNPKCEKLDDIRMRRILGTRTKTEVSRGRGFILVGPKKHEILFEIPNYINGGAEAISRATGNGYYANVKVIYDHQAADIYSPDGKYVLTCHKVERGTKSHAERDEIKQLNQQKLRERKEQQYEKVIQHESTVADALQTIESTSFGSYATDIKFGGSKESTNKAYDDYMDAQIMSRQAQKALRKLEKKEQKQAERNIAKAVNNMQERHTTLLRNRLPEIYK